MTVPLQCRAACLAIAISTVVAALPGKAGNWSLRGALSQRFEAEVVQTDSDDDGLGFGSITDLDAVFGYETPTTRWTFSPGVRGSFGFGENGGAVADSLLPRLDAGIVHNRPLDSFSFTASVLPTQASDTLFDETGEVSRDVIEISSNIGLGWTHRFDPTHRMILGASFNDIRFTEDTEDLAESQRAGFSARVERDATARTTLGLTSEFSYTQFDNETDTKNRRLRLLGTADHSLNSRWSLSGSGGVAFSTSDESGPTGNDEQSTNFQGSLAATYDSPDTDFTFGIEQAVIDSATGDTRNTTSAFADLSHGINARSRISVGAGISLQDILFAQENNDESRTTLSIAPSYSVSLTRDWTVQLGYRLRTALDDGDDMTNLVFIQFSRGFTELR